MDFLLLDCLNRHAFFVKYDFMTFSMINSKRHQFDLWCILMNLTLASFYWNWVQTSLFFKSYNLWLRKFWGRSTFHPTPQKISFHPINDNLTLIYNSLNNIFFHFYNAYFCNFCICTWTCFSWYHFFTDRKSCKMVISGVNIHYICHCFPWQYNAYRFPEGPVVGGRLEGVDGPLL